MMDDRNKDMPEMVYDDEPPTARDQSRRQGPASQRRRSRQRLHSLADGDQGRLPRPSSPKSMVDDGRISFHI